MDAGEGVGSWHTAGGMSDGKLETWAASLKVEYIVHLPHGPAAPLLGVIQQNQPMFTKTARMLRAASFLTAKRTGTSR